MSLSSLASSSAENAQKLKEAQLKIGMALKNAQYALTTHAHRSLTTALHENVNALTALSTYLSLSGSPVKAAAIAGQMAKILKSASTYVAAKERGGGGWQRGEGSHHSSSLNTSPSSSVVLNDLGFMPDSPRESAGLVADLQRAVEELKQQRDMMADEKRALEAALKESRQHPVVVTTPCAVVEAHSSEVADKDADAAIRELRAEVDSLKHEVRKGHMRAAALQDQLHEAEEQVEDQQTQVQALRLQLRQSQEEKLSQDAAFSKKEEEIKALQAALLQNSHNTSSPSPAVAASNDASGAAQPLPGYVDKDDFDALKLQNQLLQQALREQEIQLRPTDSHAVLTQQTLEEIEADHQQQLQAMKLTIQNQYNRETELLGQQRTMEDSIDELKRQLQLSSNRQWVQQEREKHLNEMDAAKKHIEQLQHTIQKQEHKIEEQRTQLENNAENQRKHTDTIVQLELHHEEQVAELTKQLRDLHDELNATHLRLQDLGTELEAQHTRTAATIAAAQQQCSHQQQEISNLTLTMTAEREQHESRVAELQQQLEMERDRAAASQSTVEERESAMQQRLAELRTSMTAEREQHQSRVAELQRRVSELEATLKAENDAHVVAVGDLRALLDAEHKRADMAQVDAGKNMKKAVQDSKVFAEAHAAEVRKLNDEHTAELERVQKGHALDLDRVCCEAATKCAVASQPVDWLKEENEVLKVQVKEWEERHKEEAKEKMAALAKVRQTEQILSSCKGELQRLKDECASMQKSMGKSLEERDAALKRLKDGSQLAEEAQANLVRLEALRKELDEVQKRLDTADKDKALLASRYKRASTEKDECADAARKLLTQYKEIAATHEKLVAQLAAAEALAAAKSREVEELTRAAAIDADLTSTGLQDDAVRAGAHKVLTNTVREKQERIEELVAEVDGMASENRRLKSELDKAQFRQVATYRLPLAAEPTSMQSVFARDMLSSLAEMRVILSAMHAQLLPILEQRRAQERSRAAAAASPSASTSAAEALEELHTAMESAHAVAQATLEHFDAKARQLFVSADLQSVVYGKLLATLQQPQGKHATSALTPALVDVSLVRVCAALFGETCSGPVPGWEENERHGGARKMPSHANQRYRSDNACSAARGCAVAAENDGRVTASTAADRKSLSMWSHCRAFSSAPTAFTSPAGAGNRDTSAHTLSPARRRTDDCEFGMLSDARYRRQPPRAGPHRRSSFGNFAVAQASISLAEERAGLRTAPTPPWK